MALTSPSAHPLEGIFPSRLTPFIGRQADVDRVLDLFQDPSIRLVTILGPGGVGKTRLALELTGLLQDQFQDGIVFIPLAHLRTVDELLPALADALDVHLPPGGDLQQVVMDHLGTRQMLLVLDNFEHLLDEAMLVHDILAASSQLRVLATSREKLDLEMETLYHLGGLDVSSSDDLQKVEACGAVRLFLQKARQVRPGFPLDGGNASVVVRTCQLLDGNPLGILMAAAGVEHFSLAEILDQINRNLDFLTLNSRDMEPRHSSIRAVFASSFSRLDEHHRAVLRKISVFRGGFDLKAAVAVAAADLQVLIALVDKSLLLRDPDSGRYHLHELLRQYAGEELEAAGEREKIMLAHATYFIAFVRQREAHLISSTQKTAWDEIQAEFDNIRQAWTKVIERRDFASTRAVIPALYNYCDTRSRFYEAEALFRQAVVGLAPQAGETSHPAWALALLSWYDMWAYFEHFETYERITTQALTCLEQARSMGDAQGAAASLVLLGALAGHQGDYETALRRYKEAMQTHPALDDVYWVNLRIGIAYQRIHQYRESIQAFQVGLQHAKEMGERVKTGWALYNIGDTLLLQGKPAEAESYIIDAMKLFREIDNPQGEIVTNYSLSQVALALGDLPRAREHAKIAARLAPTTHAVFWVKWTNELLQKIDPGFQPSPVPVKGLEYETLSERELEVLRLLKSEMSGPDIARELVVSLNTVRYHTKNIYQKLGVNSRLEAIRRARELGV